MFSILMLDDEPSVLAALCRTLRDPLGCNVMMELFTDPHDALARVGEHSFNLVMSDFRMPVMDGIKFLHFVRELQPETLRMIVSASTDISSVMSEVNDVGVFRCVVKPWTTDLLIDDVRAALIQSVCNRDQRRLADATRVHNGDLDPAEAERHWLEESEPGLTHVNLGPERRGADATAARLRTVMSLCR